MIDLYIGLPASGFTSLDPQWPHRISKGTPSLSLSSAVMTLEITGVPHFDFVSSWIDALGTSLDSLVACGRGPVMMILDALCQAHHPVPTLHAAPRVALKSSMSLVVHEYPDDGIEIYQRLQTVWKLYNSEDRSMKVVFGHCIHVLPSIRTEFSRDSGGLRCKPWRQMEDDT